MKKLVNKLIDMTFWKFILVGVANTIFGTGIMFIFYNVFHLSYWMSSASNYFFGSILSYILNRVFTFKSQDNTKRTLPKFVLHISVCYLLAYGIAKPLMKLCLEDIATNIQDNIAMLVGMCLFIVLNYLGQRFFVFKHEMESIDEIG